MTTFVKLKVAFDEILKLPETEPASDSIKGEIIQKTLPPGEHSRLQG
jgi:Uma2 family endonuclease